MIDPFSCASAQPPPHLSGIVGSQSERLRAQDNNSVRIEKNTRPQADHAAAHEPREVNAPLPTGNPSNMVTRLPVGSMLSRIRGIGLPEGSGALDLARSTGTDLRDFSLAYCHQWITRAAV